METKDKMESVLTSLFESITVSNEQEIQKSYGETIEKLLSIRKFVFDEMENFDVFINHTIDEILENCIKKLYTEVNSKDLSSLFFAYRHYAFIENSIQNLIKEKEGFVCCADKSRWLMEAYRRYILTKELPDMKKEEKCYWKPSFGTGQEWMNLCESFFGLYYGQPKDYLQCIMHLSNSK